MVFAPHLMMVFRPHLTPIVAIAMVFRWSFVGTSPPSSLVTPHLPSAPHPHPLWSPSLLPWSFVPSEQIVPAVEEFVSGLGCVYSPAVCQAITPPSKLALMPIELLVLADPEYRICDTSCVNSQVRHTSLSLRGQAPFSLSDPSVLTQ